MSCKKIKAKLKQKGIIADVEYDRDPIYGGYYFTIPEETEALLCEASDDWEYHDYWDDLESALKWIESLPDIKGLIKNETQN